MSTLLALDTATEACSVALSHGGRVFQRYAVIPRQHAQRLLPMVQELLAEAGLSLSAVDAIAFGRGPGAFTGVRIAVAVAQGLAFALQRPVLPVSDLAVIAQRAYRERGERRVAVAIDARMDEVYWGCFQLRQGEMCLLGEERVLAPEQASLPAVAGSESTGDQGWYGAGSGWCHQQRLPRTERGLDAAQLPHAEDLLTLAGLAWAKGQALPAEQAQAVYLRDRVATPKAARS